MKQYVIDQLREKDHYDLEKYLSEHTESTVMPEIFHVELPPELYSNDQRNHQECQPYYFAVNLSRNKVSFEWLIRSREKMRCNCVAYATPEQRNYIIDFADNILDELKLKL